MISKLDNPIILTAAGLVVGFLVGMTGMGGGALMTPFLILVMKINPILAVGTDLAFAAITKFVGGFQHWRQETVWLRPVMWMAVGSLPASFLGSRFLIRNAENEHIIREVMPTILGIVLLIVGVVIIVRTSGILNKTAVNSEKLQKAKLLYYEMMGWNNQGIPKQSSLEELGIEWVIDKHLVVNE